MIIEIKKKKNYFHIDGKNFFKLCQRTSEVTILDWFKRLDLLLIYWK